MLRKIMAVLGPSAAVLVLSLLMRPLDLGYISFLLVPAAVLVGAAGAFLIRPDPEDTPEPETSGWLVVLALMSAATSAVYWYRVWQYDAWDLVTIPVKFLYILGFWWPGVFLSALAWILAGPYVYRTLRRYLTVLAVGALASTFGAASYQVAYSTYYKAHDGQSLARSMEHLAAKMPGSVAWQHRRGALTVSVDCGWATEAPPYTVFSTLDSVAQTAVLQLHRADVSEVNVQVTANGLLLFTGNATDEDPGDPSEWIRRLDRSILRNNGRLDQASLDEMAGIAPGELPTAEEQKAFATVLQYSLSGSEVTVVFEPGSPVSISNIGQYTAAHRIANHIVTETVTYFPEIESFRVVLAGKEHLVPSKTVATRTFFVQADLMPADHVLGLVIREQGLGSGSLDPATFMPNSPIEANQLAIAAVSNKVERDVGGRLFQPITMLAANVIVTQVAEDGTATVFVLPNDPDAVPAGPITIPPGVEEVAASQWILNTGLMERAGFTANLVPLASVSGIQERYALSYVQ